MPRRSRLVLLLAVSAVVLAIAVPVFGADPSPSGTTEQAKPGKSDKAAKPEKSPEVAVTVRGTVGTSKDDQGRPTYSLVADGNTWELSVGRPWFWGDKNPLAPFVGKSVEVVGSHHEGDFDLDVETIDGKALRDAGRPPWAGGPWVVGKIHPGWKDWMADGKPGNGGGRENAPGQNKDKTPDEDASD
ncbi:MAG: hypothetical protein ACJ761_10235 [Chloroflexota bacterium]